MNKYTNIFLFKLTLNLCKFKNAFIKSFAVLFLLHKICPFFVESQVFIFPGMIMYKFFIYFCDVIRMVTSIYKKIVTFSYRQIM
jgi:hypothetical protein